MRQRGIFNKKNEYKDFKVYYMFKGKFRDINKDFNIFYDGQYLFLLPDEMNLPMFFNKDIDLPRNISRGIYTALDDEKEENFIFEIIKIYRDFKEDQELSNSKYKDYTGYYETSKGKIGIRNFGSGSNFVYLCDEPLSDKIENI